MILAKIEIKTKLGIENFEGEIWNTSNLRAMSSYNFKLQNRQTLGELTGYPRWCESVMGLLARCIFLTETSEFQPLAPDWQECKIEILLVPGGRMKSAKNLAMASIERNEDGTVNVGSSEIGVNQHFEALPMREIYDDVWSLAEHALRIAVFGADLLPPAKALDIPVFKSDGIQYIRIRDIPEPTRTVFDERMSHSTVPIIEGARDAVYVWDWLNFLGARSTNFSEC
jgi:hypothetical protein